MSLLHRSQQIILACLAGLLIMLYGSVWSGMQAPGASDFYKFYLSSKNLLEGAPVYWDTRHLALHEGVCATGSLSKLEAITKPQNESDLMQCLHPNLNSPVFVLLTSPLGLLDYEYAWLMWSIGSLTCAFLAIFMLLYNRVTSDTPSVAPLIFTLFFAYGPSLENHAFGQVSFYCLFALVLSWVAQHRDKPALAGTILGVLASMKLFFGIFLIALLITRQFRSAIYFMASCAFVLIASVLLVGVDNSKAYIESTRYITWHGASWNASLHGFFARLLGEGLTPAAMRSVISTQQATIAGSGIIIVAFIFALNNLHPLFSITAKKKMATELFYAITLPVMLLVSPLGWIYYFPLLIISLLVFWSYSRNLPYQKQYRLSLLLFLAMTSAPRIIKPHLEENSLIEALLDYGMPTYALGLMLVTGSLIIRRVRQNIVKQGN